MNPVLMFNLWELTIIFLRSYVSSALFSVNFNTSYVNESRNSHTEEQLDAPVSTEVSCRCFAITESQPVSQQALP